MDQKQVLELIQTIVKPLRDRIQHLEKENQKLKIQFNKQQKHPLQPPRRRSFSKQQRGTPKKIDPVKEALSPSNKKKEEKVDKPIWGHAKPVKPESNQMKSPPPKDKNIQTPSSKVRALSKDKLVPNIEKKPIEKQGQKRIIGGKKLDIPNSEQKKEGITNEQGSVHNSNSKTEGQNK